LSWSNNNIIADYCPVWFLRLSHVNTIYPTLFRKDPDVRYTRHRLITDDDDFLDVDLLTQSNKRLVILCHGLEGSSRSKYILGTAAHLHSNGWDIASMNYRGCSGEINKQKIIYNSGATYDLNRVVEEYLPYYDEIALIGFSLGGNLVLKYMGDGIFPLSEKIRACVAISVPVDLREGSLNIAKRSNFIYEKKFLKSLNYKIKQKALQYPDAYNLEAMDSVLTLYDFDNIYTGPIHGYRDADHYYAACSAKPYIVSIDRPTMIINALDDPFLPEECYPYQEIESNRNVIGCFPKYGGHVGFAQWRQSVYWEEAQILYFINSV